MESLFWRGAGEVHRAPPFGLLPRLQLVSPCERCSLGVCKHQGYLCGCCNCMLTRASMGGTPEGQCCDQCCGGAAGSRLVPADVCLWGADHAGFGSLLGPRAESGCSAMP
jgi:hypothetical protein